MTSPVDVAGYEAATAARRFEDFGIELPADAQAALGRLTELRLNPPVAPAHNTVAELLADNAKPAAVTAAVAAHLGAAHLGQQHRMAQNICGQRALDAVLADRDRIHAELKAQADEVIERIHRAAELDETVLELTKQRRVEDAHRLAVVESDCETLRALYYCRDFYLTPRPHPQRWSTGWWSCNEFSNPWDIKHPAANDGSRWGQWRAQIRAGGRLWFATVEQAVAASKPHEPANTLPPIDPQRPRRGVFVT